MRSNEMYGFPRALRSSLHGYRSSTCCFVADLFHSGYDLGSNPYISFNLMHEEPLAENIPVRRRRRAGKGAERK